MIFNYVTVLTVKDFYALISVQDHLTIQSDKDIWVHATYNSSLATR
jgi:hypothetical protein